MEHSLKSKSPKEINVKHFQVISYENGLEIQNTLWEKVRNGSSDYLLLLQHNPVITLGRRTEKEHLLLTETELTNLGIELFEVDRGGSATYHGPGQLVGYIICKASRYGGIHNVVMNILTAIKTYVQSLGVDVKIDHENPGIWTDTEPARKLAAVGMQNKKGVTLHGFALNVDLPLTGFSAIVPCGLQLPVSTLAIELGKNLAIETIQKDIEPFILDQFS